MRSPDSEPLTLTYGELVEITGYKQVRKQKAHFDRLGVPSIIRPDNTLSVSRDHYRALWGEAFKPKAVPTVRIVRRLPK